MMQGDACFLGVRVLNNALQVVGPSDVEDVAITVGHLTKTYKKEQVVYHDGLWLFPLSQEESFGLFPGAVRAQVRILWANGVVEGKPIFGLRVTESTAKEVL